MLEATRTLFAEFPCVRQPLHPAALFHERFQNLSGQAVSQAKDHVVDRAAQSPVGQEVSPALDQICRQGSFGVPPIGVRPRGSFGVPPAGSHPCPSFYPGSTRIRRPAEVKHSP